MSSNLNNTGTLTIVATPLGNPGDLSPRARLCLEQADCVLAEDVKREGIACSRWGVSVRKLISYNDHNEKELCDNIVALLRGGANLALISDAGMPVLADPGYVIVRACRHAGIPVTVVPGPCAPVTALAGSGIAPQPFIFFGFLPRKTHDRETTLAPFARLEATLVFFERKDRLETTLKEAFSLLGPREVCIARELTKTHEEYTLFNLEDIPDLSGILGEVTVVVGPPQQNIRTTREEIDALITKEQPLGGTPRAVAKRVAAQARGWTSAEIYSMLSAKH